MTDEHQAYIQLHDALMARGVLTEKAVNDYFPSHREGQGEQGDWANNTDMESLTLADHQAAELMDVLERWRVAIASTYQD